MYAFISTSLDLDLSAHS